MKAIFIMKTQKPIFEKENKSILKFCVYIHTGTIINTSIKDSLAYIILEHSPS